MDMLSHTQKKRNPEEGGGGVGEGSWIVWPGTGTLGGAPSLYHLLGKREQPSFLWTEL